MEYARSLRNLKSGWTHKLRTQYFNWFLKAANYRGGASFTKFIEFIRNDAVASLSSTEQKNLSSLLNKKPVVKSPAEVMAEAMAGRTFVKNWELEELSNLSSNGLKNRNYQTGRKMFAAGGCYACHRFGNQGGMNGPDLTGSGGRYSPHDLLEQIMYPSKEINEQFVPTFVTLKNGETLSGVVVNLNGDRVVLNDLIIQIKEPASKETGSKHGTISSFTYASRFVKYDGERGNNGLAGLHLEWRDDNHRFFPIKIKFI